MSDSETLDHEYRCVCGEGMHVDGFHAGRLVPCPRCGAFVVVPRESGGQAVEPSFAIETERLRIDLAERRRWKELLPMYVAPENYAYEVVMPATPGELRKALKQASFPAGFRKSRFLKFRVADKTEDRLIGTVTVSFRLPYYAVDLGFMVHHEFHRQGYGKESVGAVVDWLVEALNVHKITAMCDAQNAASMALLERLGFVREGMQKDYFHHPERGWIDARIYGFWQGGG